MTSLNWAAKHSALIPKLQNSPHAISNKSTNTQSQPNQSTPQPNSQTNQTASQNPQIESLQLVNHTQFVLWSVPERDIYTTSQLNRILNT